jgi:hypothetical protein
MAGDWIKIEETTPDKPEVQKMASILGIDSDAVTGKLIRVWVWASRSCNADGVTDVTVKALLDRITCVTGFADSMLHVGWLEQDGDVLRFPNFDYHNSQTAKTRAKSNKRVSNHRELKRKCNGQSVTQSFQKALPEKRREEKSIKTSPPAREDENFSGSDPGSVIIPPCSLSEATHYAATIGMADDVAALWWEKRDSEDWRPRGGELPLTTKSWKIELKTYHFNKTRIENERRRNQRTGAATAGKASENPRNRHLPAGIDQRNKDQSDMEDVRDYLRRIAERPKYVADFARERVYEQPQYLNAVQWLKEHQRGLHAESFNQLAELGFIDAGSGRWTGPRGE